MIIVSAFGVSMALAQGGQGGGGRGQRGGGFGQRGGGNFNYELNLLNRSDVQKDLGLTNDQKTKVEDYIEKNRPQRGQGGGGGQRGAGGGNGGGGGQGGGQRGQGGGQRGQGGQMTEEMMKAMAERREKTRKDLLEIISDAQLKRVDEIHLQLQGNMAIMEPDVQKALGLSSDQTDKIKDLQTKQGEANRALFQKVRDQEISREDMQAAFQKNNDTMKSELGKILTSDQAAKLKAMQGKPFTADEDGGI
ncbi:MAG: hypothetical protein JST12_06865 [Armatimonadetes bacterium]|nr:hypothetical protein [Armatimonadota bacterium]